MARAEEWKTRRLLCDIATDLDVGYHHLHYLMRHHAVPTEQDELRGDLVVPAEGEQRLRELIEAERALHDRAVTILDAAGLLGMTPRVVEGLVRDGQLAIDAERGPRGARMVTRSSIESWRAAHTSQPLS